MTHFKMLQEDKATWYLLNLVTNSISVNTVLVFTARDITTEESTTILCRSSEVQSPGVIHWHSLVVQR